MIWLAGLSKIKHGGGGGSDFVDTVMEILLLL